MAARMDAELDLHGYTAAGARDQLETVWARRTWHGLRRVRIIHGTGEVLYRVVRRWADDKAIPWTVETHNPGVTVLQPALRREQPANPIHRPFARYQEKLRAVLPPERPTNVNAGAEDPKPVRDARSADLFAEELARLDQQDARAMHRRKHGG